MLCLAVSCMQSHNVYPPNDISRAVDVYSCRSFVISVRDIEDIRRMMPCGSSGAASENGELERMEECLGAVSQLSGLRPQGSGLRVIDVM